MLEVLFGLDRYFQLHLAEKKKKKKTCVRVKQSCLWLQPDTFTHKQPIPQPAHVFPRAAAPSLPLFSSDLHAEGLGGLINRLR